MIVTGARQVGKTSLVRRVFPDHRYVTLDLQSDAALADQDPATFLARHPPPLIVDEVQYAPGLFRHLKLAIDRDRERNGAFVLTGTQKLPLMQVVSESLAGRADIIELEGLAWSEVHAALPALTIEEVVVRGGFPELYEKPELDAHAWYRSYVATYLERDVRQLHAVGNLRDFERFLRVCALRSAGLLNKAELARDVAISGPTAAAWLSALEASGQVALLQPWFSNATKSLVKTPKLFMIDSGLCAYLCGIRGPPRAHRLAAGGPALGDVRVLGDQAPTDHRRGRLVIVVLARSQQRGRLPLASRRDLRPRRRQAGRRSTPERGPRAAQGHGVTGARARAQRFALVSHRAELSARRAHLGALVERTLARRSLIVRE